jgi:hypothetical protein
MKQRTLVLVGLVGLFALLCGTMIVKAQVKPGAKYEAAILKWDGDDKVWVTSATKNEVVHVYKEGGQKIKDGPEEEYCVTFVANKMAAEGWELVNLNNRRILMQRPVAK